MGAIESLKEKSGSSLDSIKKYIESNYKVEIDKVISSIRKALIKGVEKKTLLQTKGKGSKGFFKIAKSKGAEKTKKTGEKVKAKEVKSNPKTKKAKKEEKNTKVASPKKEKTKMLKLRREKPKMPKQRRRARSQQQAQR